MCFVTEGNISFVVLIKNCLFFIFLLRSTSLISDLCQDISQFFHLQLASFPQIFSCQSDFDLSGLLSKVGREFEGVDISGTVSH